MLLSNCKGGGKKRLRCGSKAIVIVLVQRHHQVQNVAPSYVSFRKGSPYRLASHVSGAFFRSHPATYRSYSAIHDLTKEFFPGVTFCSDAVLR